MVRWESELIPIISNAKQQLGGYSGVAVEVPSGYGIADLVFYEFNDDVVKQRIKSGLTPIDQTNLIRVLVELRQFSSNETINITMLRRKAPFLKSKLITYLVDNNFLVPDEDSGKGSFKKGEEYQNGLKDVVAIEAKLKDWKRGLYQAYRYRTYADKSYLAVYTKAINAPLKNISEFKKFNVGLIEVADDFIKIHHRPRKEKKSDSLMKAIAYENLLAFQEDLFPDLKEIPALITI